MPQDLIAKLKRCLEMGPDAPDLRERERLLRHLHEGPPEAQAVVIQQIVSHVDKINRGLSDARESLAALAETNERLTRPPWQLAVFRQFLLESQQAVVAYHGQPRVVTFAEDLDVSQFARGDDVFLNSDLNLLVGRAPWGSSQVGETAEFQQYIDADRMILKWRDDEVVVETTTRLAEEALKEGDLVRWQRENFLALEKMERHTSRRYFLDDVPDVPESEVGGQQTALAALNAALISILADPGKAAEYDLSGRQSVLLVGPPGCGKTLMARIGASNTMRVSGKKCHFALVKPAEWESPYVGETQANIRRCFESLKERAGEDEHVILFLDEVESSGRTRGHLMGHHSDKFIAALLAELDGFTARGGVAIIAATNRKDLIDPALLERLSDVEIQVPRPNIDAAEEIFNVHLSEKLPFSPNGTAAPDTRTQIIDVAISRLYDPNGNNEVSTVKFRDGAQRTIRAGELMSGRIIGQICRSVRQRAFLRDVTHGDRGIRVSDMEEAAAETIGRLSTTLSQQNIRDYLSDLPQDMDIVSVEPVVRRVDRAHRFVNVHDRD